MSDAERAKWMVHDFVVALYRGDMEALRALLADEAEIQGVLGKDVFAKIEPIWRRWGARDAVSQARQLGIPHE